MFLVVVHSGALNNIDVDCKWNVLFLKQRICQDLNLNADTYSLLYKTSHGYQNMHEDSKLLEFDLTPNSHVYLCERYPKERYFIFCYPCESIRQALITYDCSLCESPFLPFHLDVSSKKCMGKCSSINCTSVNATVKFSCTVVPSHNPTTFLKHVKHNNKGIICAACTSSDTEMLICLCENDGHSLCVDCFKKYSTEYFSSGMFQFIDNIGYTIICPAGCPNSFVTDPHHFRILGSEFYSAYKEQSAKRYLLLKGSTFCPSCGLDWQIAGSQRHVEFPRSWYRCIPPVGCGSLFCSSCGWIYKQFTSSCSQDIPLTCFCEKKDNYSRDHSSVKCNAVWNSLKLKVDDAMSHKYINETCRHCPCCKSPTQKLGGCNHIHCSVCGFDWCWVCCEIWSGECLSSHWL
ncbi:hypothetical protein MN116_003978 [Schistosoma mekongi]|uniref:RBR-type E3 ubiquitin transferase n=1 Tax=Schistosoma mekongi TaxID=38744 RepID=A0AAE1ZF81_SCHME|nr:hypothetical protein MN116_003978 [Schistosoma mekongi]